jgi:hypothetical protein
MRASRAGRRRAADACYAVVQPRHAVRPAPPLDVVAVFASWF